MSNGELFFFKCVDSHMSLVRLYSNISFFFYLVVTVFGQIKIEKKGKRKVHGVPQSQTAALPKPQEEEEVTRNEYICYVSVVCSINSLLD